MSAPQISQLPPGPTDTDQPGTFFRKTVTSLRALDTWTNEANALAAYLDSLGIGSGGSSSAGGSEIGLFTDAASKAIPLGTDRVLTTGYSAQGVGAAAYVYSAAVDATYVADHPYTAFISTNGRGFRLYGNYVNGDMLGIPRVDESSPDSTLDGAARLQALLDFNFDRDDACNTFVDVGGHFAVASPVYQTRPLVNSGEINVEYHGRTFFGDLKIHVLPVAQQPGGTAMATVLTLSGPYEQWTGEIFIHSGDRGQAGYSSRRFDQGVSCIQMTQARIERIVVTSAKHDAVAVDAQFGSWSLRSGSAYAVTSTSRNSIGLQIGSIIGVNCGSTTAFGETSTRCYSTAISALTQGGDPGEAGTFDATSATYITSNEQRTKVTVASTAELRKGEHGLTRQEIPAATFGTVAVNATDTLHGTLVWSSGDPVAQKLVVGQIIYLRDGSNVGANDNIPFEITGFSGTSNRTISVVKALNYPVSMTTETAKAYTQIDTEFQLHRIMRIEDSTKFWVHPWVPSQHNSSWYHVSGASLFISGNDAAVVGVGYLSSLWSGVMLRSECLYGPVIDKFCADLGDIAVWHGISSGTATLGTNVGPGHSEGMRYDVAIMEAGTTSCRVAISDTWSESVTALSARSATDAALQATYVPPGLVIELPESHSESPDQYTLFNGGALSNRPSNCRRFFLDDLGGGTKTVTLSFYPALWLLGYRSADFAIVSYDGTKPLDTFNFALDARMTNLGWALAGQTSIAGADGAVLGKVYFDYPRKKALILPGFITVPDAGPWKTKNALAFTSTGEGDYLIEQTTGVLGQATFAMQDDFRIRIQPQQSNRGILVGVDGSGVTTLLDQNTFDAYLYIQADTGYGPYVAGYGTDTGASATYSYAANDWFWLEKRGTVLRAYKGGPEFVDAVLFWTWTIDVSALDFVRIMVNGTPGSAGARVKMFPLESNFKVVSKSSTYTETTKRGDRMILASGTFTINLPPAAGNETRFTVKLVASGTVTIDPNASETIDGSSTLAISTVNASATFVSDGTNWQVISKA